MGQIKGIISVSKEGARTGNVHVYLLNKIMTEKHHVEIDGPGEYVVNDVSAGGYYVQAFITDKPVPDEGPPISFADGQYQDGALTELAEETSVAIGIDITLVEKDAESQTYYVGGKRTENRSGS